MVWKNGATTLASKNSGGATHISNGIYYAVLGATDTDTVGPLVLFVHVSGALSVRLECVVLAENVYDSLIGASDNLQVDVIQLDKTGFSLATAPPTAAQIKTAIEASGSSLGADPRRHRGTPDRACRGGPHGSPDRRYQGKD